jgi:hypothetical protein
MEEVIFSGNDLRPYSVDVKRCVGSIEFSVDVLCVLIDEVLDVLGDLFLFVTAGHFIRLIIIEIVLISLRLMRLLRLLNL